MIQYVTILTKDRKSLLIRNYGISEVDRDLLVKFLSEFSGFMKEISQSDIKSTQTADFKYFYTIIDPIIIVVVSDLEDDDATVNSKILSIRAKFMKKYAKILEDGSWGGNRSIFTDFEKELDDIILGAIKVAIVGFGGVGKTDLTKLICGKDVNIEYVPTITADIAAYHGDEFERSITLWDFGGQVQFRSLRKSLLQGTDITLLVVDSTYEIINNSKEIIHEILDNLDKYYQNKMIIGIANYQDMPNRLNPKFCEKIMSDNSIKFYGIDTSNPVYREKILAILSNAISKLSHGKENITCDQCGITVTSDFFKILQQTRTRVKDLSYCPKCNFPLRYIHYEDCINIRTYNPLITSYDLNRKDRKLNKRDQKLNKRFKKQWIDYFGIIFKRKEQVYSNIDLAYLEEKDKVDYITESFFSGNIDQKILDIYSPFIEKCNFPTELEQELLLPKCFSLENGNLTYIIIGVLSNANLILKKIAFFIKNLFTTYAINFSKMDSINQYAKNQIRDFIDFHITHIENGDFNFLRDSQTRKKTSLPPIPRKNKWLPKPPRKSKFKRNFDRKEVEFHPIHPTKKQQFISKNIITCVQCGMRLSADYAFCDKCGTKIVSDFTPSTKPSSSAL